MIKIICLFQLIILINCISCTSEITEKKHNIANKIFDSSFDKGIVHVKIKCKSDTNVSYSLFLPLQYKTTDIFPLIIFFDSHAKGSYPIEKYKSLADKFGYIIAASNNSKNGLSTEITNSYGIKIKQDILQRFSVDDTKIYAAGFSGGARVAGALAFSDATFSGVIGCSAGIGQNNQTPQKFDFLGIAGTNDMNYNELVTLENNLGKTELNHFLLTFDGKHEWAPSETMEDAFLWLHLNAVKTKKSTPLTQIIKDFESKNKIYANTKTKEKDFWSALNIYKKLVAFLNGINDVSNYKNEILKLEAMSEIKKALGEKQNSESKEQALQQAYLQAFQSKDSNWWKSESLKLRDHINKSSNIFEKAMFNRIFGYLSLVSFSYVNRALQSGDINTAEHFNEIYGIIDPAIPDHNFFAACIYTKKGDNKNAIISLHNAIKKGFDDIQRLQENEMLNTLKTDKEYSKIIDEIKEKTERK